ncbi:MAG: ketopantoate reductase C-terminal domain-containing protein, partial [Propionicimonas sp.]
LEVLGRLGPANYTSMAQDAMAGRRTEVDIFAGEVIQRGAALGVDVPVNATLYGLLKAAEPWLV